MNIFSTQSPELIRLFAHAGSTRKGLVRTDGLRQRKKSRTLLQWLGNDPEIILSRGQYAGGGDASAHGAGEYPQDAFYYQMPCDFGRGGVRHLCG